MKVCNGKVGSSDISLAKKALRMIPVSFLSLVVAFSLSFAVSVSVPTKPAYASCAFGMCPLCPLCISLPHAAYIRPRVRAEHREIRRHVRREMQEHYCLPGPGIDAPESCFGYVPSVDSVGADNENDFIVDYFWKEHVLSAMMSLNEQIAKGAMAQMFSIGAFFDARQQLETQQLFQEKMVEAHRDYHSSVGMCTMGTAATGLPKTSMTVNLVSEALSTMSLGRQMHSENRTSSLGESGDIIGRAYSFRKRFCDPEDSNANLSDVCSYPRPPDETLNKDVDFIRTVYHPLTVELDLDNNILDGDEPEIFAMAQNLFAHNPFSEVPPLIWEQEGNTDEILDMRAILAKRSVAEHSFYTIVGMKASSTEDLEVPMSHVPVVLQQLGMSYEEAQEIIGERPSYWALMEILSKKIYQSPDFYINLQDKPANTLRKEAAIKAVNSIQSMDRLKSQLRNEAMLAVLVELELMEEQARVARAIGQMRVED